MPDNTRIDLTFKIDEYDGPLDATLPEQPVVIRGVAALWPAKQRWSIAWLRKALSEAVGARAHDLYYIMPRLTLASDIGLPELVRRVLDSDDVFPLESCMRIWANRQDNVSNWHYDSNLENVFNVQVKGKKAWQLVSPQTPMPCYPFSNFAILTDDAPLLRERIHTSTVTEEGDLLYIPPLWSHQVVSQAPENINVNWVVTKRRHAVPSPALERELERYLIDRYWRQHGNGAARAIYAALMNRLPHFVRMVWHYDELTETDVALDRLGAAKRVALECLALGRAMLSVARLHKTLTTLDGVAPLRGR
ncbi:MAG: hypothetical protein HOI95_00175 [Chromatiales bacterium]|nr:hypothetical protein [Chromatiales bacterium]